MQRKWPRSISLSPLAGKGDPLYSLIAFKRVALPAGTSKTIIFYLDKDSFSMVDENGEKVVRNGEYKIQVGGSLPGNRSKMLGATAVLEKSVDVTKLLK